MSITSGLLDLLEDCAELPELYHSRVPSSVFCVADVEYHAQAVTYLNPITVLKVAIALDELHSNGHAEQDHIDCF